MSDGLPVQIPTLDLIWFLELLLCFFLKVTGPTMNWKTLITVRIPIVAASIGIVLQRWRGSSSGILGRYFETVVPLRRLQAHALRGVLSSRIEYNSASLSVDLNGAQQ